MRAAIVVTTNTDNNYLYTACQQLRSISVSDITVLLIGKDTYSAINCDADRAVFARVSDMMCYQSVLMAMQDSQTNNCDIVVFSPDMFGQHMCAMHAVDSNKGVVLDCQLVAISGEELVVNKSTYNMNLTATSTVSLPIAITLSQSAKVKDATQYNVKISSISNTIVRDNFGDVTFTPSEKAESIARASRVIALGKGVGRADNFDNYRLLASKLCFSIGGTRPVALDGNVELDNMIGISSKFLSADRVLVFGASGAKPFVAGLDNCSHVIAVNSDPDALIFSQCDVGIVGDCNAIAQAMVDLLNK